jgi:4-diphosphocytidyl-2-C-methyl-D-erythritol kinase
MGNRTKITLLCPAKINLGLRIVGRRQDGYHLLESLFWPLSLVDELSLVATSRNSLETEWHPDTANFSTPLPSSRQNLVYKVLESITPSKFYKVNLKKRIPIGAGLGGGSSNAGRLLDYLLSKNTISKKNANSLALKLGADVPFFLNPGPAWITGIGENSTLLKWEGAKAPLLFFLLLIPPKDCPTPKIFKLYDQNLSPFPSLEDAKIEKHWSSKRLFAYLKQARNDLEPVAIKYYPLLGTILSELRTFPSLYAGLSGTGSTCFAVFPTNEERRKTTKALEPFFRKTSCRNLFAETFYL